MHLQSWPRTAFPGLVFCFAGLLHGVVAVADEETSSSELRTELRETEVAFAQTMANRDLDAFAKFLSGEVVFFTGERELRGRNAVSEVWAPFFDGADAPFSWRPETVAVLESGNLGFTSGPVFDPDGEQIGTFNSVWRRLPGERWKIIFDRGCPPCECP